MTNIQLEKLAPEFLEPEKIEQSGIWNHHTQFNKGEKLQVVAPSGSGKTSLFHFIYGLRKDYTGKVLFDEKDIRNLSIEDIANLRKKNISIIFQDLRLFPDHTAFENIEVKRVLNPFHAVSRIEEMAAQLGIQTKLNQPASSCSHGEQQRIAIIRALQQPFDFLLMDEPFSHLDENNRQKAMALIESEAALRNAGIILADLQPIEYFKAGRLLNL